MKSFDSKTTIFFARLFTVLSLFLTCIPSVQATENLITCAGTSEVTYGGNGLTYNTAPLDTTLTNTYTTCTPNADGITNGMVTAN